ncbi:MAG: hypothetical protein AB1792_11025 [Candidatus Zixiibacteriota bacterium]
MKSSPVEPGGAPTGGPRGALHRARKVWGQITTDFRSPLPDSAEWSRARRLRVRLRLLYRRYGWKLVLAVICYYAVRDLTLYVIIPYLVARRLIAP